MSDVAAVPADLAAANAVVKTLAVSNATYAAVAVLLSGSIQASTEQLRQELLQSAGVGQLLNLIA